MYDAIIVGAGPAGCVLASRLSEDAGRRVLLIEAGEDVAVPGAERADVLDPYCLNALSNRALFWDGVLAETGVGAADGTPVVAPYLQALGVGGGSNINGMAADRGLPGDYDEWGELGAEGWSWKEVLPYFVKLERDLDCAGPLHGDGGPMPVRRLRRANWAPFARAVGDALERRGFPFLEDYAADFRDGLSEVPTNCLPERRVSAAMAYLPRQVRSRPNLEILPGVRAERVSVARGVADGIVVGGEAAKRLLRGRQVIVTCGAVHTPALLMRSGVGPSGALASLGIDVVHDLPGVGENLQNHPSLSITTYLRPEAAQPRDNLWLLQNWLRFSSRHADCTASDMHLMAFNKCAWHALGRRVGLIAISVLKPYSSGRVELASADPASAPRVRFNLFKDSRDEVRLTNGVRFALELLGDPAVAALRHEAFVPDVRLVAALAARNPWNGVRARAIEWVLERPRWRRHLLARARLETTKLLDDAGALRAFVREHAHVQYHVAGTCRMGRHGDAAAVVDGVGKVHGIRALRIADASIFPTIPRGYTHFIVIMCAEKIAAAIRAEWRGGPGSTQ